MNDVGDRGNRSAGRTPRVHQSKSEMIQDALALHEGSLLRYAQHFVGDLETARDIVQDTFLKLCKQEPTDVNPHLAKWLFAVTRNRAIDVCRKENRMELAQPESLAQRSGKSPAPEDALEKREMADSLLSQVKRLPGNQQEVLRLKFNGGLSYAEIANVTGLSKTNVGFILHTAISKLRQRVVE